VLKLDDTALVAIDVQGKLAQLMHNRTELFKNLRLMIQGAQVLGIPILWTEQYPKGLGPTVQEVSELLPGIQPIAKNAFSCCGERAFRAVLEPLGRRQILLTGIEAHVCVHQTAMDLLEAGYEVQVIADAVSSRTAENRHIGLEKMRDAGVVITSTETALFELIKVAEGPQFKQISKLVK
jgi:nicotinamidase-related amidase